MIVTKLVGGLGNQMFQYASGYGIASKLKTDLAMDISWFSQVNSVTAPREYELDCFDLSFSSIELDRLAISDKKISGFRKVFSGNTLYNFKEYGLPYDPKVYEHGSNLLLDGYWQSEKYFADYRSDILKEFRFKSEPSLKNAEIAKNINTSLAVSLHVRRGDYAKDKKTNTVHGLVGLEYYQSAILNMEKSFKNPVFFVFSDEPEWCKKNLKIKSKHTFVSGNSKGCYDMQLMTMCSHHIIANSSFSWWGAWLNPKQDKVVIAPKQWFGDKTLDSKDIVPASWKRL